MTTHHHKELERGEDTIEVTITCQWSYNRGEFIEAAHPYNGYGKGWICDEITAHDDKQNVVELTAKEREQAEDDSYHQNLR